MLDSEFLSTLFRSETFWSHCLSWVAAASVILVATLWLALRRRRQRDFLRDESGSAQLFEVMYLLPVYMVITGLIVQFLILSQTSLILHQAAYAAARSALVHKCPPPDYSAVANGPLGAVIASYATICTESPEKWDTAARLILISASQSSEFSKQRQNNSCNAPTALIEATVGASIRENLREAVEAKACYAFEPGNVLVTVDWETDVVANALGEKVSPLKAEVIFRYPIVTPGGGLIAHGTRGDGTRYRVGRAEITLL